MLKLDVVFLYLNTFKKKINYSINKDKVLVNYSIDLVGMSLIKRTRCYDILF